MRYKAFPEVIAKYSLVLGLDEQAPASDWDAGLRKLLAAKRKDLPAIRNPALRQKAERECAELEEAAPMALLTHLFGKLQRCLREDKQETFEWELRKPENQAALPRSSHPLYGQYLDIREEARKKWPNITLPSARTVAAMAPAPPAVPPGPAPAAASPPAAPARPIQPALPGPPPPPKLVAPPAPPAPVAVPISPLPAPALAPPLKPPQRTTMGASDKTELLAATLRHQLAAAIEFGQGGGRDWQQTRARTSHELASSRIRTFHDLFNHAQPPVSALKRAKDFFKQRAGTADERQPDEEVAFLLYLLSIITARVRLGAVISKLSQADLLRGTRWALDLPWLDTTTRQLLLSARSALEARKDS